MTDQAQSVLALARQLRRHALTQGYKTMEHLCLGLSVREVRALFEYTFQRGFVCDPKVGDTGNVYGIPFEVVCP